VILPGSTILWWTGGGVALLSCVIACAIVIRRRRKRRRRLITLIESIAAEHRRDVLVTDESEGWIHADFLLRTAAGIFILDVRDVRGALFGGEHLDEWTVMDGHVRRTFSNPLESLYDRVAAVRAIVGDDVPVEARVVLLARARFATSPPPRTLLLEDLTSLAPPAAEAGDLYAEAWQSLCARTQPTPRSLRRRG
jgi:hypothetical protein